MKLFEYLTKGNTDIDKYMFGNSLKPGFNSLVLKAVAFDLHSRRTGDVNIKINHEGAYVLLNNDIESLISSLKVKKTLKHNLPSSSSQLFLLEVGSLNDIYDLLSSNLLKDDSLLIIYGSALLIFYSRWKHAFEKYDHFFINESESMLIIPNIFVRKALGY